MIVVHFFFRISGTQYKYRKRNGRTSWVETRRDETKRVELSQALSLSYILPHTWCELKPNDTEPNHTEPNRIESNRTESNHRTESNGTEPNRIRSETESNRIESNRTEPMRTGPDRTEPNRTDPNGSERIRTEPIRTDPNRTKPNRMEVGPSPAGPLLASDQTSVISDETTQPRFWPVSGPFSVRARAEFRVRGWVGSTLVP